MTWEDGLLASECTLRMAHMECDAKCDKAEAIQQDYWARIRAFTTDCRFDFDQVLRGCRFLLSMQEMDLERREEKLAEEQVRGLYSFDKRVGWRSDGVDYTVD
jgi:hypothetical protein